MSDFKVTYKTRNVNSKRLLKEFKTIVEEVCDEYISRQATLLDKTYDYDEFKAFLHMYLEDLHEKGVITQFDVISDHRINNELDVRAGRIRVLVKFRQTNCVNVTEILMEFHV
jgi:hypothetical protein